MLSPQSFISKADALGWEFPKYQAPLLQRCVFSKRALTAVPPQTHAHISMHACVYICMVHIYIYIYIYILHIYVEYTCQHVLHAKFL